MPSPPQDDVTNTLQLSRVGSQTLPQQLAAHYAAHIRHRLLSPGARLPSVREAARRHAVNPHTMVAAYDQLLAQGLIEVRPQRGFFVRDPASFRQSLSQETGRSADRASPSPQAPVDASALIRGMLGQNRRRPGPGLGTLPSAWLDLAMLRSAMRRALAAEQEDDAAALLYGDPAGDPRLRSALAARLAELGIHVGEDQLITTIGATQALDLVSRALLRPGAWVLVDDPGWSVEYARLSQLGLQLLPVPRGAEGPDLATMETLVRSHRPQLYVTVSVLHNPTGGTLGLATAHRLLQLAQAHDFMILEDDSYAHLAPAHAPRLAALDGLQRTFYVGSFSKVLAPGWRVGFVAGPQAWTDRLIDLKMLTSLTTPALPERAIAECLEQGLLRRHAERVTARLDAARARSVRLALESGCEFVTPPQGIFGWVETGVDTEPLAQHLLDRGWLTAPGHLFHAHRSASTRMRINFATSQDAAFWRAFVQARDTQRRR